MNMSTLTCHLLALGTSHVPSTCGSFLQLANNRLWIQLYLTLANNRFIGEIPHSIGKAANTLLEVLFLNNQLSGCLPYEIGLLKKATVFDVGSNMLTGPIPHSFQCLEKMELLNLARNKFYGAVPEAVCNLPKLENFTLSNNYFTQVGPQCRKLIKDRVLDVKMNCILDLPNQRSPSDCAKFFSMTRYCPNEKSLSYVPCRKGVFQAINSLESSSSIQTSDFESTTPPASTSVGMINERRRAAYVSGREMTKMPCTCSAHGRCLTPGDGKLTSTCSFGPITFTVYKLRG